MGRAYSQPKAEFRGPEWVITRVQDPDDEFAEYQVLCMEFDQSNSEYADPDSYGFRWKPTGSSYDGSVVWFRSEYETVRAIAMMLYGRDSVSVYHSL
jgi:hypothetical protein